MRSVCVHIRDATADEVAAVLQHTYPFEGGPPWICEFAGDPCLYIDFYHDIQHEFPLETRQKIIAAIGKEPQVSVAADVSGRHPGDEQVRTFVLTLLDRFQGIATDDYSDHCWSAEEIR